MIKVRAILGVDEPAERAGGHVGSHRTDETRIRAELARFRMLARAWADSLDPACRAEQAAVFARRALESLAAMVAPQLVLRPPASVPLAHIDRVADQLAISLGETASGLPICEALHAATSLYPAMLPSRLRSELGAFYTPPALVQRLFDQAESNGLEWGASRILDPAAGGGVFLHEAIRRMVEAQPDCEPTFMLAQIGNRLAGFEIDPHAASLAQTSVEILLSDLTASTGRSAPIIVKVCDTLEAMPDPIFDLVIGNPPYGRTTLSAQQRRRYSRGLYGHANLYGIFTDAALRWTKIGGLVAYLTPTSFLSGQYFAALRRLLADDAPPVEIDFLHARRGVFEDVQQEALLAIYKRGGKPGRAQINYLTLGSEGDASITRNGTVGLPKDSGSPWLAPRSSEHSRLISYVETMPNRLADWGYSVATGPLVWNRFKDQLRDRATAPTVRPLIWAEAITPDGRFVYRARKRNHAPYFQLKPGDDWLLVDRPCVLVQRTTAKEQNRRLIAAELPAEFLAAHGGVVVENHLNMVRAVAQPKVPTFVVAALLNSRIVDEIFRCISGSVAVSAFELEALPLPGADELQQLEQMISCHAPMAAVDAECARLYGQQG